MNCFNIRELQGILKRKFFTDLVNSNDHRDLLNNSMIGVRYKLNHTVDIEPDVFTFYNFGLLNTDKIKSFKAQPLYIINYYENKILNYFVSLNLLDLVINTIKYYTNYFYKYYLTFDV